MTQWIGSMIRPKNWREQHSLALTNDQFGSVECRATIRAVYDHITRELLDRLSKMGYDISSYRDANGRWTINVDSIESMFVGEQISVDTGGKASAKAKGERKTDAPAAAASTNAARARDLGRSSTVTG